VLTLNGLNINELNFSLKKQGDLLHYEGPLLSHFIGDDGKQYLLKWLDNSEVYNRWLIFNVSNESLLLFFEKKVDLRYLILNSSFDYVYVVDIDNALSYKNIKLLNSNSIPDEYLPPINSFYNAIHFEPYASELYNIILSENEIRSLVKTSIKDSFSHTSEVSNIINKVDFDEFYAINRIVTFNIVIIPILLDLSLKFKYSRNLEYEKTVMQILYNFDDSKGIDFNLNENTKSKIISKYDFALNSYFGHILEHSVFPGFNFSSIVLILNRILVNSKKNKNLDIRYEDELEQIVSRIQKINTFK